jgi:hypothetical protein
MSRIPAISEYLLIMLVEISLKSHYPKNKQLKMSTPISNPLNCRNVNENSIRIAYIKLIEQMNSLRKTETEEWYFIPGQNNYLISSWCRLKNMKSYGGKPRILAPSFKNYKYLYYTITKSGKRESLSICSIKTILSSVIELQ